MIKFFTFHMKTYQIYKEFSRVTCSAAFYMVCDNFIFLYGQIFERLTTVSKWALRTPCSAGAYIQYMGGIEPGTPKLPSTLTYLARVAFITKVDFTDNIHQGQNRSHSKYFLDNIRGSNIPLVTTIKYSLFEAKT